MRDAVGFSRVEGISYPFRERWGKNHMQTSSTRYTGNRSRGWLKKEGEVRRENRRGRDSEVKMTPIIVNVSTSLQ